MFYWKAFFCLVEIKTFKLTARVTSMYCCPIRCSTETSPKTDHVATHKVYKP